MTIDQILRDKGHEVKTIPASTELRAAAQILDDAKIGAVVALEADGSPCGVLSERDIVRQFARFGEEALSLTVSGCMTRDIITAAPTETVDQGLERMTDRRIRHLPVIDAGKLVGLISIGDLVKWKIAETEMEAEAMKSYIASG